MTFVLTSCVEHFASAAKDYHLSAQRRVLCRIYPVVKSIQFLSSHITLASIVLDIQCEQIMINANYAMIYRCTLTLSLTESGYNPYKTLNYNHIGPTLNLFLNRRSTLISNPIRILYLRNLNLIPKRNS